MSQAFIRRLSDLENVLVVGDDRQQLEYEKRYYYNLPNLSTPALVILMRAAMGETEIPQWLEAEIYKPIPPDTSKWLVERATAQAKGLDDLPVRSDEETMRQINQLLTSYAKTAGRPMDSLADVQAYLEERERERGFCVS